MPKKRRWRPNVKSSSCTSSPRCERCSQDKPRSDNALGLKGDLNRLRVIQYENTNSLPLLESRPAAAGKDCFGNRGHEIHLAIAHRLPNLARPGEDEVGRQ